MLRFTQVLVSESSFASEDPYDIVESSITVVNLLREEGVADGALCPEALLSYWVDFYRAQAANGGLSQFVYNSRWRPDIVRSVDEGLAAMGASEHAGLFQRLTGAVAALGSDPLAGFLAAPYFDEGSRPVRDLLDDRAYFEVARRQDLVALNAAWLRSLPNLLVRPIDGMFAHIEERLGRPVNRG